ncbi:MAG TPA: tetratricopeptide repeat protein [Polyangiaceae bacterium]|jgi:tetratricopeptide (TPR) repeat protein|nr:tetratricopeptide repeat protein [Polyangiaceae bacterium]
MRLSPLLVPLVLCIASSATAAPSFWDAVRDPSRARVERALTQALRAREPREIPPEALDLLSEEERAALALRAVAILQEAGGEALNDPEVSFFLGDSLVLADHGQDEEARRILRRALAAQPDSPEAAHAWFQVGIASNRLRQFDAERAAYSSALRLQWDRNQRSTIYMNRGEAGMSLGLLKEARADYEAALALTDDSEIHALSAWGLAVALARDEDLPDALRRAWEASQFRFRDPEGNAVSALELPGVFYTPDYEVYFYRALGAMAAAEHADKAEERKTELEWAVSQWQRYLAEARPAGDRWTSNVEFHLTWCQRRLGKR